MLQRFTQRQVLTAIGIGLLLKAALFLWTYAFAGVGPLQLMRAHDGTEYIEFARIIGSGQSGSLPEDVVRHDVGLPAMLAVIWTLTGKLVSLELCALVLQLGAWVASVILFGRICQKWRGSPCAASVVAVAAAGYPTLLYFGQFNLTEPPFMALILGSLLLASAGRFWQAVLLAGVAATIRSTGLLLVISLLMTHPALSFFRQPGQMFKLFCLLVVGITPWLAVQGAVQWFYGANVSSHKPAFGLPFSGFRDIAEAGAIRSAYIVATVGFFLASAVGLLWQARRQWQIASLQTTVALFFALFVTFHLCLKTLFYIDREVYTFDYQDRYLVPLWPLAILVWQRYISWPVASGLLAGALLISAYWMRNYLAVAELYQVLGSSQ